MTNAKEENNPARGFVFAKKEILFNLTVDNGKAQQASLLWESDIVFVFDGMIELSIYRPEKFWLDSERNRFEQLFQFDTKLLVFLQSKDLVTISSSIRLH